MDSEYSELHSLEEVGFTLTGPDASSTAVPFASIVVPTGTTFELSGYLAGDEGFEQWVDVTSDDAGDSMFSLGADALIGVQTSNTAVVPEPGMATIAILGAGLVRRRRRGRL